MLSYWLLDSFDFLVASAVDRKKKVVEGTPSSPLPTRSIGLGLYQSALLALLEILEEHRNRFYIPILLSKIESDLIQAGNRSRVNGLEFLSRSFVLAIGAMLTALTLLFMFGAPPFLGLLLVPFAGVVAVALQILNLQLEASNRTAMVDKRLPFATEFILMIMQASGTFESGVRAYGEQMTEDPLAAELLLMQREMALGVGLETALNNMVDRVKSTELRNWVTGILTGKASGQSMEQTFQLQAENTRLRRYQNAEEMAKSASSKALFPLMLIAIGALLLLVAPLMVEMLGSGLF
jgi:tight adherence protein C